MAYWLEIHCDVGIEGSNPHEFLRPLCRSHENRNVSGFVTSLTQLNKEAKRLGWKLKDGDWICPGCYEVIKGAKALKDKS